MSYAGIVQIDTLDSEAKVNQRLGARQGWELLAVTPGKEGPLYTIGRREEKTEKSAAGVMVPSRMQKGGH
ncbi:hypothetical protein ALP66_03598 [Pseudomonas amygdali pv. photiniae]|uniref:Type IV secretion system family protein n=1 Tax=Pseudomonas amygdali pv. photiniae TaxID=251724 RepID=A0A0P9UGS0_PSEA0|nr:hypothetical protein [Pseudomonas amygdali]KPX54437.1 hypothetical protein ALO53_200068 [Pseudomonas amygdali pv. photiniae]RMS54110.1 hypothetical protein ALP66_03598 [Pseudomonas amygdali pv. photiniae]